MNVYIKCLVPIGDYKIKAIKLLRLAFDIGLKDAKDLADKFHNTETIIFESGEKYSMKRLTQDCSFDGDGNKLLEYSIQGKRTKNGFCTEDLLEKIKFFAGLALDNEESILAEDLLHVYNKHSEE